MAGDSSSLAGETTGKLAGVKGGLNCLDSLVGEPRLAAATEDPDWTPCPPAAWLVWSACPPAVWVDWSPGPP